MFLMEMLRRQHSHRKAASFSGWNEGWETATLPGGWRPLQHLPKPTAKPLSTPSLDPISHCDMARSVLRFVLTNVPERKHCRGCSLREAGGSDSRFGSLTGPWPWTGHRLCLASASLSICHGNTAKQWLFPLGGQWWCLGEGSTCPKIPPSKVLTCSHHCHWWSRIPFLRWGQDGENIKT